MSESMLRLKKNIFARPSLSLEMFKPVGDGSFVGGVTSTLGRLQTVYARNPVTRDSFGIRARSFRSPTYGTAFPLTAKEATCDVLYGMSGEWDVDVRFQSCGLTSDPNNWDMIKRICRSSIQSPTTDQESSYSPDGDGEIMHTLNFVSAFNPTIICPVSSREFNLTDIYSLSAPTYPWSTSLYPLVDVRYGCEWVLSLGDSSGYGFGWGEEIDDLEFGRWQLSRTIKDFSVKDRTIVVVDSLGNLWYSLDGGANVYAGTSGLSAESVYTRRHSEIWIATSGGDVYKSYDGGRTLITIPNYGTDGRVVVDIIPAFDTIYFSDTTDDGLTALDEEVVQRITNSSDQVIVTVGRAPNMTYSPRTGIIHVGGNLAGGDPALRASLNAIDWITVYSPAGVTGFGGGLVMPVTCGCGVVWMVTLHAGDADNVNYANIWRSVDNGLAGTWKLEWTNEADTDDPTAFGFFPTDIACCGPNHVVVVGLWLDWNDLGGTPAELYVVELSAE